MMLIACDCQVLQPSTGSVCVTGGMGEDSRWRDLALYIYFADCKCVFNSHCIMIVKSTYNMHTKLFHNALNLTCEQQQHLFQSRVPSTGPVYNSVHDLLSHRWKRLSVNVSPNLPVTTSYAWNSQCLSHMIEMVWGSWSARTGNWTHGVEMLFGCGLRTVNSVCVFRLPVDGHAGW